MPKSGKMQKIKKNASHKKKGPKRHHNRSTSKFKKSSVNSEAVVQRYNLLSPEIVAEHLRLTKRNMFMILTDARSMSCGLIQNSIRYMMVPVHYLKFCIFGRDIPTSLAYKNNVKKKWAKAKNRAKIVEITTGMSQTEEDTAVESINRTFPEEMRSLMSVPSITYSDNQNEDLEKQENDNEESNDEMMSAMEDSDCDEEWGTANNTTDYDNALLNEAADVPAEERALEEREEESQDSQEPEKYEFSNKQENSLSLDEEISEMFQRQCTSSEDEVVPCCDRRSPADEGLKSRNYLLKKIKENYYINKIQFDEVEQKKKAAMDLIAINSRRQLSDKRVYPQDIEKHMSRYIEDKVKQSTRQITATTNELNRTGAIPKTRTRRTCDASYADDISSDDDDIEMINLKQLEKLGYRKHVTPTLHFDSSQIKEMKKELDYAADSDDSNDSAMITRKQISPSGSSTASSSTWSNISSISSNSTWPSVLSSSTPTLSDMSSSSSFSALSSISSTTLSPTSLSATSSMSSSFSDLNLDEYSLTISNGDIAGSQDESFADIANTSPTRIRPPPGFPEIPQNPPMLPSFYATFVALSGNINGTNRIQYVPPAPAPMRHLYYDYPEFMHFPFHCDSAEIEANVLTEYLRINH